MKPIIGIVARPDKNENHQIFYIHKAVSDVIIKYGGIPLVIIPTMIETFYNKNINNTKKMTTEEFEDIKTIIDKCDGIILQGGDDFYDYDLKIVNYLYKNNIPTLGICLGMQTMSYFFDGEIKDLPNLNHKSKEPYVHEIIINKNSKLYEILNIDKIKVNSRHKSYVVKTNLDISSKSTDNIIESIENKNKKFFIGVEWHPENMIAYDIVQSKLLKKFIDSCR